MKNVKKIEIKLEKEWVDSLDAVFKKKNKEVKIDGFRKGMASKEIYLKHFYDSLTITKVVDLTKITEDKTLYIGIHQGANETGRTAYCGIVEIELQ